ncbi:hypothetical protein BDN71DRAFT_1429311 [Pleurotus eryngii]|uniref:Uncharacterized protein n=1 Tax=Pleurotus eryngii TaxID=5323 RepID=A0A9P6A206_PLEER|nr:hypothetical protein BDN71DRAFT_1429311 [Pleurotus eryngii]
MPALTFLILTAFAALSVTAQCNPGQFNGAGGQLSVANAPKELSTMSLPQSDVALAALGFIRCPGGQNSPVRAISAGDCGSNAANYPAVGSCAQTGNSRTCPATFADSPTNNVKRRRSPLRQAILASIHVLASSRTAHTHCTHV